MVSHRNSYYYDFSNPLISAYQGVLYIEPVMTDIYYFSPSLPLFGVGVLADHLLAVSCSATTTYLC